MASKAYEYERMIRDAEHELSVKMIELFREADIDFVPQFIDYVENYQELWCDLDPQEWADWLDLAGLDYYTYDDPETMWEDFKKFVI